ncbi:MAG TPA: FKBP-type peptidyl-prolyl cis-trans isomerase [Allosphingosinicella sp.]|jgi:peptidylprolyl isomerase|nr:FKBP-type peptidyl-prolyl cis-trans isomerase [Allosphingosinicella sp.]
MLLIALLALQAASPRPDPPAGQSAIVTTASGLRFEVLEPGQGRRPGPRDSVEVTYEVRLADGRLVESAARPEMLPVTGMIDGFTEALQLMNQGGRYRFRVPPALGYGTQGIPCSIPPDADLVFTLTLHKIIRAPPRRIR